MMFWFFKGVKFIFIIVIPVIVVIILISVIKLYCKCWWNKNSCVPKYTSPQHYPATSNDINLATISAMVNSQPHQVAPQVIQVILKSCNVDLAKFECYKQSKANHQTTKI